MNHGSKLFQWFYVIRDEYRPPAKMAAVPRDERDG